MIEANLPLKAIIFTCDPAGLAEFLPACLEPDYYSSPKKLKKVLRSNLPDTLFLHVSDTQSEEQCIEITRYVRSSLASQSASIIFCLDKSATSLPNQLLERSDADDVILLDIDDASFVGAKIARLIKRLQVNKQRLMEKVAQVNMLTSVNRFSHQRQNMQNLITSYSEDLLQFCRGHSGLVVTPTKISSVPTSSASLSQSQLDGVDSETRQYIIDLAMQCKAPVVELTPTLAPLQPLIAQLPDSVASYLIFPLIVYRNNLASIICFISEEEMDSVSTTQLNIMRDASMQLKLILERRFAESRMASHYQRLKNTLAELKTTQEHLIHAEKMASVGQMAAGIAHEINNPLAYVISNFDPLDQYVETLISMVDLHEQLINSIKEIEQPIHQEITQSIKSFKQDSDIDFVTEDIKALVHDSKEGLLRVRDIISDLGSFSRKEPLERQLLNMNEVISETIRLLKFELSEGVDVQLVIESEIEIISHRGFIQQIIANLIKNANQAHMTSEKQGNEKIIRVCVEEVRDVVRIKIADNAGGIPEKTRKHIFDPFFTTKDVGKGTGLGLSVSFNLAKKMHGVLALAESNDLDTMFILTLPKQIESTNEE